MMIFIIVIHVIICVVLIGLVLIQRGRGSGLVESFSGVESMFGTKTNTFLTRTTTILSILFFLTCLSLAVFSIRQSKSLMTNIKIQKPVDKVAPITGPTKQITPESPKAEEKPTASQAQNLKQVPNQEAQTQALPNAEIPKTEQK